MDHALILHARNMNMINLEDRQCFRVCSGCESHEVIQAQANDSIFCRKCQKKRNNVRQRDKSMVANKESRVDPSSRCNWSHLTSQELSERARRANYNRKSSEAEKKRLIRKLSDAKIEVKMSSQLADDLNAEIKALNQNSIPLRGRIMTALQEMVKEESMVNIDTEKLLTNQDTT